MRQPLWNRRGERGRDRRRLSADAAALAVVADDPDAPAGTFTDWSLWNVPADTIELPEDVPQLEEIPALGGALQGENDFGEVGYRGPCPPEGDDPHEYRFTLYVLDEELDVDAGALRPEVQDALDEATPDSAQFTGTFGRESRPRENCTPRIRRSDCRKAGFPP